jgi:acyl-CoA thioesterase I
MIARWFWREWRSPSLLIVWLALSLAVACVLALGNISDRMEKGLSQQSREFMAGDRALRSSREVPQAWLEEAQKRGLKVGKQLTFATMTFAGDTPQLANVKAVDDIYPMYGDLQTNPPGLKPQAGSVLLAPRLMALLNLKTGDTIDVGDATLRIAGEVIQEPDSGFNPFQMAPRLMMNFNNVFRWHLPFLFLVLLTFRAAAADTLLILGDSLSAGYRMSASAAWPALLNDKWQSKTSVVNASISGDTSQQGLARLPALLKQHQPRWVLVELGGNDGLRGFQPQQTEQTLRQILQDVKAANAEPLLMQIRLPANYGRRYNEAFSAIYPKLAKEFDVPLLPFFMEEVYLKPQWMQDDGIHPNRDAQPFIADWMAKQLQPLVNHDS